MEEHDKPAPGGPSARGDGGPGRKRPYRSPALVEYGSVAKLTRGTKSINADGGLNTMKQKAGCL